MPVKKCKCVIFSWFICRFDKFIIRTVAFISREERKMTKFILMMVIIMGFYVHSADKIPDFEQEGNAP